jgi:hypothetical protein
MRSLSRKSYALHQELAEIFGAERIGYRPVRTFSVGDEQGRELSACRGVH